MSSLPNGYDTMRFLRAGIGSSVVGTGLTLREILAGPNGVTLVYVTADGREARDHLALGEAPAGRIRGEIRECADCGNRVHRAMREISGKVQWAELDAWQDDRDFQCGLSTSGAHAPAPGWKRL